MLYFLVFAKLHSRRSPSSFLGLTPVPSPLSPNSHGIISPLQPLSLLNPVVSYRYKNKGGGGLLYSLAAISEIRLGGAGNRSGNSLGGLLSS